MSTCCFSTTSRCGSCFRIATACPPIPGAPPSRCRIRSAPSRGRGIRTIVNLRGEVGTSTYAFEQQACEDAGLKLVDFRIRSRAAPDRAELLAARDLFANVEYPMLMHCKSGADRVGLMSALYLHVRHGVPIEQAKRQLSLRYGHIRQADTGVLDYFFERYLADTAENTHAVLRVGRDRLRSRSRSSARSTPAAGPIAL